MEIQEEQYHQIERYLANELGTKELEDFETELQNNPVLRDEIDIHREIAEASLENDVMEFRKKLTAMIKSQSSENRKGTTVRWFIPVSIAASIAIIISLAYMYTPQKSLFDQYFEPYPDLISARATAESQGWVGFYNDGDYDRAIVVLENLESISEDEKMYLGISYLATNELSSSQRIFSELLATKWKSQSKWYLALSYLKSGNSPEAINLLMTIHKEEYMYKEARELVKKLTP